MLFFFSGKQNAQIFPDGGAKPGGDGGSIGVETAASDGGGVAGGDGATFLLDVVIDADGGVVTGGDGVDIRQISFFADGGGVAGGDGATVDDSLVALGGSVAGGDGASITADVISGTGGSVVGGDAALTSIGVVDSPGTGGSVVGGDASVAGPIGIVHFGDGGVQVGGDGADFLQEISILGAVLVQVGGDGAGPFESTIADCTFHIGTDRQRGKVRLRDILFALKREIVNFGVFLDHQVYIRLDLAGTNENPPNDNFLEIIPLNELSDQATLTGGGTEADMRTEPLDLRVYNHLETDQKNRHTLWTIDQCRGASRKADELHKAIQLLDIIDASGTGILAQPMRVQRPTGFQIDRRGFGFVSVMAEIVYTAELELVP